jgi:hypothetical protein
MEDNAFVVISSEATDSRLNARIMFTVVEHQRQRDTQRSKEHI